MWMHFSHRSEKTLEWGFYLDSDRDMRCVPAVGDFIWLDVGIADSEQAEESVKAKVISREWVFSEEDGDECYIELSIDEWINPFYEAHSEVWPLQDFTKRKEEIRVFIENLGNEDK